MDSFKKSEDKKEEDVAVAKTENRNGDSYDFLIEPWVTEKSHELMSSNKYVFKVNKLSNKRQIRKSVESLYDVKVTEINVVNIPAKKRRYGKTVGVKSGIKKAMITLKKGDSINLFEGA